MNDLPNINDRSPLKTRWRAQVLQESGGRHDTTVTFHSAFGKLAEAQARPALQAAMSTG